MTSQADFVYMQIYRGALKGGQQKRPQKIRRL